MLRILALTLALTTLTIPAIALAASDSGTKSQTKPHCSSSDPLVWVNTKTNVYHTADDQYFGKTKSGKYACTSQATASGAHLAGSKGTSHATSPKTATAPDDSDSDATPQPNHKKHKKHSTGTPDDSATP